jgi:hypothetical protein
MEMAFFEIGCIQSAGGEPACVNIKGLGGLQLYRPTGRQRSQMAACVGRLAAYKQALR